MPGGLSPDHPDAPPRRWVTLASLALFSFLLTLDDTALSVALPDLGRTLGLGLSGLEWVVNAYTVTLASLLLAAGRLADTSGSRRVFVAGLAVFTAASLASGLAPTGALLIGARVLQGAGAALMMPASLAIVSTTFPAEKRGLAIGVWTGVSAAGLALGPLVGAALTQSVGWQAVFFLNVPFGLVGLTLAGVMLPARGRTRMSRRFDVPGVTASAAALVAIVFALTEGMSYGWASPLVLGAFALGAISVVIFVWVEGLGAQPLVELEMFRSRNLAGANGVSTLSTAVMCGVLFFVSLFLQVSGGYTAVDTGLAFLPMTALIGLVAPLAGTISDRLGRRAPAAAGMLILAAGLWLLSGLGDDTRVGGLLPGLIVSGLGIGVVTAVVTAAALDFAPSREAGIRAGILNSSRMVGLALGVTLMGAIVAARWPGGLAGARVDREGLAAGLAIAFRVNAGIALLGAATAAVTLAPVSPHAVQGDSAGRDTDAAADTKTPAAS